MAYDRLKIISGNGNLPLAESVAKYAGVKLVDRVCGSFPDGETKIKINESIRGDDVFIFQSMRPGNTNNDCFELFLLGDAVRRCGAKRTTAVVPYAPYTRQDRSNDREPLSFAFFARACKDAGFRRYVFIDLHNPGLQNAFGDSKTIMDLPSKYLYLKELRTRVDYQTYKVGSPDMGGLKRVNTVGKLLGVEIACLDKARDPVTLEPKSKLVTGDVKNETVVMIDDMVATASTLGEGVTAFKDAGAKKVIMCAAHALLVGKAVDKINKSGLDELIITDTLSLPDEKKAAFSIKLTQLSWAERLAKLVILPLHTDSPTTHAFEE